MGTQAAWSVPASGEDDSKEQASACHARIIRLRCSFRILQLRDTRGSTDSSAGARVPAPSAPPTTMPLPATVAPDPPGAHQMNIGLGGWPTRHTATASHGYTDGAYRVALTGQPSIGVSSRLPTHAYRLSIDIALDQGAAGLVFLAAEPAVVYRIMFDRECGYAIEHVESTTGTPSIHRG